MNRLCGRNESCFVPGDCWGHLSGVMCKYLSDNNISSICTQDYAIVDDYTTKNQFEKLLLDRKNMKKTFKFVIEVTGDIISTENNYFVNSETKHAIDKLYEDSILEDFSSQIMNDIIQTEAQTLTCNADKSVVFTPEEIKINKY